MSPERPPVAPAGRSWDDLSRRLLSGAVLTVVGLAALMAGGVWLDALASAVAGLMIWELARMTAPSRPGEAVVAGLAAASSLAGVLYVHNPFALVYLFVPVVILLVRPRRDWLLAALAAAAIMLACYAIVAFRGGLGRAWILWLVAVVVASDTLGYFGGKAFGGAKFWPAISPRKTWAGTVAGWVGAVAVGAAFWLAGLAPAWIILLSPVAAFAGQMGDIAESWLKRRAGVKDSSDLIPGHGGVMDRFDALTGTVLFLLAWNVPFDLPQIGA
ncbi:MAG: phosphatidate cytidylyltransferase [Rhodobacteraceae bacterium]|nr:phosphatidate cytidylyltransferase [Paracoccaceae bacterium]